MGPQQDGDAQLSPGDTKPFYGSGAHCLVPPGAVANPLTAETPNLLGG